MYEAETAHLAWTMRTLNPDPSNISESALPMAKEDKAISDKAMSYTPKVSAFSPNPLMLVMSASFWLLHCNVELSSLLSSNRLLASALPRLCGDLLVFLNSGARA